MKKSFVFVASAFVAIVAASTLRPTQAETPVAATAGSYTVAQAAAGAKIYAASCSACHGATLRGVAGPALIGDAFTSQFTNEPASDAYHLMAAQMPVGAPGSLSASEYLALMAYILHENHYPAGPAPLTEAKLKSVILAAPAN